MKILVLNAHPYAKSFCNYLALAYKEGAIAGGNEVQFVNLRDLKFDPILRKGYSEITTLELDLEEQQKLWKWCEHLVIVTPVWWSSYPSLLKGYFDRILLPGFAYKYHDNKPIPKKLLEGRSARVIYTQNSPKFYTKFLLLDSFWRSLRDGILSFCGFKPVERTFFTEIMKSNEEERKMWINEVYEIGKVDGTKKK